MQTVISANRFLDLLCCVIPAVSHDDQRPDLLPIQLEIIKKDYSIRAVATDGAVLSVAKRQLGFSVENQNDIEDIQAKKTVEDCVWLLSRIDVEILILSLKKLGVRRDDLIASDHKYYIKISDKIVENISEETGKISTKKRLSISILGSSHVVLEPTLVDADFPEWQKLMPTDRIETSYLNFNLEKLRILYKCWGEEAISMVFYTQSEITKIIRRSLDSERQNDFILLMPLKKNEEVDLAKIDENQMNFFE